MNLVRAGVADVCQEETIRWNGGRYLVAAFVRERYVPGGGSITLLLLPETATEPVEAEIRLDETVEIER